MDDDILRGIRSIRPQAEIGLEDELGIGGVFSGRVRPANQNEEMFTPEQPDMRGVASLITPAQRQALSAMGFQPWHLQHMSPEQARDIILQDNPSYDWSR